MRIHRHTLPQCSPLTLEWFGEDCLIDWAQAGLLYHLDGRRVRLASYHYSGPFDCAITSLHAEYAFVYQRLGTKGLLLKNGELLREINRPYYQAHLYEYPAAFITVADVTYLIHCPLEYNQLDFEEVETGKLVTHVAGRRPSDFFHSRLEYSPDGRYLLSKGWAWQPWDLVEAFDIAACLANPLLLDDTALRPAVGTEVCTAGFITDELVLLGTSGEEAMNEDLEAALPPASLTTWNIRTGELSAPVRVAAEFGNLFPVNEKLAWDLYKYPKLLDLATGAVLTSLPELPTGLQRSAIIGGIAAPPLAYDRLTGHLAFQHDGAIEVLSVVA